MNQGLLQDAVIICGQDDPIGVAKIDLPSGSLLAVRGGQVLALEMIPRGQRIALKDIPAGVWVVQYGYPFARSLGIKAGALVSNRNTENAVPDVDWARYQAPPVTVLDPGLASRTFQGFRRLDGRIGTRNYYLVVPASMCASETALQVARRIDESRLFHWRYPRVDGVVAIPHSEGCGCDSGLPIDRLLKVLKGYITHPNVGGCLVMDMGCEQTDCDRIQSFLKQASALSSKPVDWVSIQKSGGSVASRKAAQRVIARRLPEVNRFFREPVSVAGLVVGTECGASDAFSGITANPLIGAVADRVVQAGGAAVLTEVTEMIGTLPMLLRRFRSAELARKFQGLIDWYEDMARRLGVSLTPNLVPKNIEGGLINNVVKSLGAVMKGGTTAIEDVLDYADRVKRPGLSIMQGPGNDPESVTGLAAGGVNIILFSTGQGTTTGDAIVPVIKIATTHELFRRLPKDMDVDAGRLLDPGASVNALGDELFERVIRVASGQRTWSERWKQRQFQIWTVGKLSL